MDWLSQTTKYLAGDLEHLKFFPDVSFRIRTVTLTFNNGSTKHQPKDLHSEEEYVNWVEQCRTSLQDQPTFVLVIHERHDGETKSMPYSRQAFEKASAGLFQHRSLALSIPRTSTAIFNSRRVDWTHNGSNEQSIVYNCRSDTEVLGLEDDVLLSTTYFRSKPWTFSVMYGCAPDSSQELVDRMRRFKKSAFHPLMMPMVFAEHERSRFMAAMELKGPKVKERMLDLKNSLEADTGSEEKQSTESVRAKNRKTTERDWESTNSWVEVSELKIGMESFRRMLVVLKEQFGIFGHLKPRLAADDTNEKIVDSMTSEIIQCRLKEMDAELDTKIRECDGLLNGMTLAIQVEWNHYTRRDAKANIFIAHLSHLDSAQMKLISLVGMIFLPGTFLATLFSMSFFRWLPDDSPQMVSPYVAVYFGLTAVITAMTILGWRWNNKRSKRNPSPLLQYDLFNPEDLEKGLGIFPKRKRSQDSDDTRGTEDVEMQVIGGNQ